MATKEGYTIGETIQRMGNGDWEWSIQIFLDGGWHDFFIEWIDSMNRSEMEMTSICQEARKMTYDEYASFGLSIEMFQERLQCNFECVYDFTPEEIVIPVCECGGEICGTPHTDYCPAFID